VDKKRPMPFEWAVGVLWIVLLWTWIAPIADMSEWTEPEKTIPLYAATAFFIAVDMLRIPAVFGVPLKAAAAFLAVGWLFRETGGHSGFGLDWLRIYGSLSAADGQAAAAGEWENISPENRTVIFLAGWAMLAGVVQAILIYRQRALWLVISTWSYLVALQLWPGLDTSRELLAAGISGTALLAVLHLERIRIVHAPGLVRSRMPAASAMPENDAYAVVKPTVTWTAAWSGRGASPGVSVPPLLYAAALMATFLLFIGALAAAGREGGVMQPLEYGAWDRLAEAFRPDRSDRGGSEWGDGASMALSMQAVTGYGENDSRLGGPLTVQEEVVFTARTPVRTYWRGESKSYYDGSGWTNGGIGQRTAAGGVAGTAGAGAGGELTAVAESSSDTGSQSKMIVQEILYSGPRSLNLLFAGGEVERVESMYTLEGQSLAEGHLQVDRETGRYSLQAGRGQLGYARFQVRSGGSDPRELIQARGEYPEAVREGYLQLPARLPERVKKLAADTASAGLTAYAKALLIEQYLKETYTYSLTDVSVPASGQDFADAFLFGGKGGYCDYFSTAMTVMLRSVGVPARWVKGFAPGEQVFSENGVLTFVVSTNNAHSWVEAYIPGAGWVAFDPTPGFTGFEAENSGMLAELEPALKQAKADMAEARQADEASGLLPQFERLQTAVGEGAEWLYRGGKDWLLRHRMLAAAILLALGALTYVCRTKGHLLVMLLLLLYRKRGEVQPVLALKLLDRLWLRVFRRYGDLRPGQTLREYALDAGGRAPEVREALIELVQLYEHVRYAEGWPPWLTRHRMTALWHQLFGASAGQGGGGGVQM
jgi:hypothetical protein